MASYDGTITLDPTIINTKEELEDRLKRWSGSGRLMVMK